MSNTRRIETTRTEFEKKITKIIKFIADGIVFDTIVDHVQTILFTRGAFSSLKLHKMRYGLAKLTDQSAMYE